jgi:hypothetical protein
MEEMTAFLKSRFLFKDLAAIASIQACWAVDVFLDYCWVSDRVWL